MSVWLRRKDREGNVHYVALDGLVMALAARAAILLLGIGLLAFLLTGVLSLAERALGIGRW